MAPDSAAPADGDPEAAAAQTEQLFPGMMATMFPDESGIGMHRSATIDFGYVVSGRCVLELDDGSKTELGPGAVIVQNGTAHRWSNPWDEPCVLIGGMIGAHMK